MPHYRRISPLLVNGGRAIIVVATDIFLRVLAFVTAAHKPSQRTGTAPSASAQPLLLAFTRARAINHRPGALPDTHVGNLSR